MYTRIDYVAKASSIDDNAMFTIQSRILSSTFQSLRWPVTFSSCAILQQKSVYINKRLEKMLQGKTGRYKFELDMHVGIIILLQSVVVENKVLSIVNKILLVLNLTGCPNKPNQY